MTRFQELGLCEFYKKKSKFFALKNIKERERRKGEKEKITVRDCNRQNREFDRLSDKSQVKFDGIFGGSS